MARPVQPITPAEPLLVVDGHTPFVAHSPVLTDDRGEPISGRSCTLALVDGLGAQRAIHGTLEGAAVAVGDGTFSRSFTPRALWLHLATHAHRVIYLRARIAGQPDVFTPLRVVWRAATYPTPET